MKNIITTSIAVIAILHTCNANADTRSECMADIAQQYLDKVKVYQDTGQCQSGGRLQALYSELCKCLEAGKTVVYACPALHWICCSGEVDYDVTSTSNHVQTAKKHTWNASTNTCSTDSIYRCETGYYGNPPSQSYGCNRCPEWTGVYHNSGLTAKVYGTTDGPGATAATDCYIPVSTFYYDSTGTFSLTEKCWHD